ncbi:MAG TPA: phage major capsid protein, partial [Spirochaetota bacterium]|nr:phage major capsid protein [Spirochaetota bacterium]
MQIQRIALGREMYDEAKSRGLSFTQVLLEKAKKEGKFSDEAAKQGLENVVLQQLAARDLRLSGANVSLVDDFYRTEDNKVLFPEYINTVVRIGMMEDLPLFAGLADIKATSTGIQGISYPGAEVDLDTSTGKAKRVAEGMEFPVVLIKFKNKEIKLRKIGYKIQVSYEADRRMPLNVFNVTMKVIGRNITREKINGAVDVLINGDGNTNPIGSINSNTSGTLAYRDIIKLKYAFRDFQPTGMIAPSLMAEAYENLDEYKSKTGPTMSAPPKVCDGVPANKIIALDKGAAL